MKYDLQLRDSSGALDATIEGIYAQQLIELSSEEIYAKDITVS